MSIRDKLQAAWRFIQALGGAHSPPMGVGIISETVMESIKAKRDAAALGLRRRGTEPGE